MSQFKYITSYKNWLSKINENSFSEEEVSARIDELNGEFESAASDKITTGSLMKWFHGMMNLYDETSLKSLVFSSMKPIWVKYFKQIYPIFSTNNRELTANDIQLIKRYKKISAEESSQERSANDLLNDLGFL